MNLVTAFMMIIGGVMFFASVFYRAPDAPSVPSFNPKHWTPVWKQQSHFRGPGYTLMRWGIHIVGLGFCCGSFFWGGIRGGVGGRDSSSPVVDSMTKVLAHGHGRPAHPACRCTAAGAGRGEVEAPAHTVTRQGHSALFSSLLETIVDQLGVHTVTIGW